MSLKDLITRFVERGLQLGAEPTPGARPRRDTLPEIIPPRGRRMLALSNAEIQAILDAEDACGPDGANDC